MKAMIFAAGTGSRLQPITLTIPKGLVNLGQYSILELVTQKLVNAGVKTIVINVHHHARQMKDFIGRLNFPGVELVISDESDLLLDTGGGLIRAANFFKGDQPFFVYNVDVLSDIDLKAMLRSHTTIGAIASLAVTQRNTTRYLLVNEDNILSGWENTTTGEKILCKPQADVNLRRLAFSGIHLLNPSILELIKGSGSFAIMPQYLELAKENDIYCFEHNPTYWADIGTPNKLEAARQLFENHTERFR